MAHSVLRLGEKHGAKLQVAEDVTRIGFDTGLNRSDGHGSAHMRKEQVRGNREAPSF
jgi:hypothetical protein